MNGLKEELLSKFHFSSKPSPDKRLLPGLVAADDILFHGHGNYWPSLALFLAMNSLKNNSMRKQQPNTFYSLSILIMTIDNNKPRSSTPRVFEFRVGLLVANFNGLLLFVGRVQSITASQRATLISFLRLFHLRVYFWVIYLFFVFVSSIVCVHLTIERSKKERETVESKCCNGFESVW